MKGEGLGVEILMEFGNPGRRNVTARRQKEQQSWRVTGDEMLGKLEKASQKKEES